MRRSVVVWALVWAWVLLGQAPAARASFVPWDALVDDSWIYFGAPQTRIELNTVNGGPYDIGFDQVKSNHSARGENALRFSLAGSNTGHLVSDQPTGSFGVSNIGGTRTFRDLILLVAVDATSLDPGFSMSLAPQGATSYSFDPAADFSYYSHPEYGTGRPSGYYSASSPTGESISYSFASGMVSLYAAANVSLAPNGTVTFDYSFANLPGTAVFSVYGFDSSVGWIYHTNRSVLDNYDATSPLSTFEVRPVPEPASLLLFCGAASIVLIRGKHWRQHRTN